MSRQLLGRHFDADRRQAYVANDVAVVEKNPGYTPVLARCLDCSVPQELVNVALAAAKSSGSIQVGLRESPELKPTPKGSGFRRAESFSSACH